MSFSYLLMPSFNTSNYKKPFLSVTIIQIHTTTQIITMRHIFNLNWNNILHERGSLGLKYTITLG